MFCVFLPGLHPGLCCRHACGVRAKKSSLAVSLLFVVCSLSAYDPGSGETLVNSDSEKRSEKRFDLSTVIALLTLILGIIEKRRDLESWLIDVRGLLEKHSGNLPKDSQLFPLHLIHIALIVVVLCLILNKFWKKNVKQSQNPTVLSTFKRFRGNWVSLWAIWLAGYGWRSFTTGVLSSYPWLDSITDIWSVLSGYFLWCCFLSLDRGFDDTKYKRGRNTALLFGLICVVCGSLDRKFGFGHVGVALVGLNTGLALACFVGRLGSHHLKLRTSSLVLLYLYAMTQCLYPFLDILPNPWPWLVFLNFLVLKALMSVAVLQMLKSGDLLRYLEAAASGFGNHEMVAAAAS